MSNVGQNLSDAATQLKDGAVQAGAQTAQGAQDAYKVMADAVSGGGAPGTADQDAKGAMQDGAERAKESTKDAQDEAAVKAEEKKAQTKEAANDAAVGATAAAQATGDKIGEKADSTKKSLDSAAAQATVVKDDAATKAQEGLEKVKS